MRNIISLTENLVKGCRWDIVFNICEGMFGAGREAQVPALPDAYRIPYVFSGPLLNHFIGLIVFKKFVYIAIFP